MKLLDWSAKTDPLGVNLSITLESGVELTHYANTPDPQSVADEFTRSPQLYIGLFMNPSRGEDNV